MKSEKRNARKERELVKKAADVLRELGRAFPSNPCNTKGLLFIANTGHVIRTKVVLALDEITAGPHADFDYLESAREMLNDAERDWKKAAAKTA